MRMRVNVKTGEYDQEDVFSMITAAMGKCLIEEATQARVQQSANLTSCRDQNGDEGMLGDTAAKDEFLSGNSSTTVPETITVTRDELIKLATQIAEEMVAKRDLASAPRSFHLHQRWKHIVLWTCCNCGYSPMPVSFELSCVESLCGHHRCDTCDTFEGEAALPVLKEEDEEEQEGGGQHEIADHFLGSRSEGSAAVSQM